MRNLLLACSLFGALSCGGAETPDEADLLDTAQLSLTRESLATVTAVEVTVLGVELLVAGGSGSHVVSVDRAPYTVDLLELRHHAQDLLGDMTVDGKVTQIRIVMDGSVTLLMPDGSLRTARVPSGERTGIKIITEGLELPTTGDILLAFDPATAIHETGTGELIMRPTIKCEGRHRSGRGTPGHHERPDAGTPSTPSGGSGHGNGHGNDDGNDHGNDHGRDGGPDDGEAVGHDGGSVSGTDAAPDGGMVVVGLVPIFVGGTGTWVQSGGHQVKGSQVFW